MPALTWDLRLTLAGADVTHLVAGRTWHRQEEDSAHLARCELWYPSGTVLDPDAAMGETLTIEVSYDGGSAWSTRFAGVVTAAGINDEGGLDLLASDDLQGYFESLDSAEVQAAIPGSRWQVDAHGQRTDGWRQAQDCLATVPASYHIDRSGAHRLTDWAAGSPAATLQASQVYADSESVERPTTRERVNTVVLTVESRGPVLRWSECAAGFGIGVTMCQYLDAPFVCWPQDQIRAAVEQAGPLKGASAVGGGSGIAFTQLSESGAYNCGGGTPVGWSRPAGEALAASWTWVTAWAQTATLRWAIGVSAPDSVAAYGAHILEDTGSRSQETDYGDWGQTAGGALAAPGAGFASAPGGGQRAIAIDEEAEAALLEALIAEARTRVLRDHRASVTLSLRPDTVVNLDLQDTLRVVGERVTTTAKIGLLDEYWDLDDWDTVAKLVLRPSRCPGAGGTDDPVIAPARPDLTESWSLTSDVTFPVQMGGDETSPVYSEIPSASTNRTTPYAGSDVYPVRVAVERPAVPAAARDEWLLETIDIYEVYPPHEELVEVAP